MKVRTKLALAFALHGVILVGLLVHHVATIRDAVTTSHELSEISSRLQIAAVEQLDRIGQLEENASKYLVTREPGYLERFNEIHAAFDIALRRLDSPSLDAEERRAVERLSESWPEFASVAEGLPVVARTGSNVTVQEYLAALHATIDSLRLHAQGVGEASQVVMEQRLERTANAASQAERLSWFAAAAALILSILVSGFIVRSITDRLNRLGIGTREVAGGNFDYRLDDSPGDEFAELARDFNTMTSRLDELDRMKQSFVSKVSHDLKTPLSSMREVTGVLLDELPGPLTPKQRELLELNLQSGRRLAAMIGKLLDLSRMEEGALRPEKRTHELEPLVHRAIAAVRPLAGEAGPRLETELPEETILLECDADRVHQLIENLLENALKYAPNASTLRLTAQYRTGPDDPGGSVGPRGPGVPEGSVGPRGRGIPDGSGDPRGPGDELAAEHWRAIVADGPESTTGAVLFGIEDEGPGVPDDEKERIFDRFYQSESGRAVRARGVGLGLTICREIVAAHGGTIWVEDRVGGGARFRVLLPRALRLPHGTRLDLAGGDRARSTRTTAGTAPAPRTP